MNDLTPPTASPADPWGNVPHQVVLCNFGGPTRAEEVEAFLVRLFEDPFIIRTPMKPALRSWLARYIARRRAPKALAEYQAIGFSPINQATATQARLLEALLRQRRPDTRVLVANRYTGPTADEVVRQLDPAARTFVLTLYPHLCHSTTVSSLRDLDLALERRFGHRDHPSTRIYSWWADARFLAHGAERLTQGLLPLLAADPARPVRVLFSAHGIPLRYHRRGDPYVNEIAAHFAELRRRAELWLATRDQRDLARVSWHLSFQSRVGPVDWVQPYTDATIARLGHEGGGALLLVPISFTADHIETLYEMDHTYRNLALASGFADYGRVVPANEDPELAAALADVLGRHGF